MYQPAAEPRARFDTLKHPCPEAAAGTRRVLIADDDAALRRSLTRLLEQAGFEVVSVADGTAAPEEVVSERVDVIVTDVHMPGTTGIDLLRVIRAYDLDVPVLLMTGEPEIETAMEAVELGALQYLRKPVDAATLTGALERASRLHRVAALKREAMRLLGEPGETPGDRLSLDAAFDRVLSGMWMAFQPIVSFCRRRAVGYEALMRSEEPSLPNPPAVLSAAERLGRLPDLGRRVRELVAREIERAPSDALVFVNLHTSDLLDPQLADETSALSKHAGRVVLEITERAALSDIKDVSARVSILRYLGYKIAIDDLGAGYAGLTSFAQLEPEYVKLDRALVTEIHRAPLRRKLVGAIAAVCEESKMKVIAEGVELADERETLMALGCELMQGYLFARPGRGFPTPSF